MQNTLTLSLPLSIQFRAVSILKIFGALGFVLLLSLSIVWIFQFNNYSKEVYTIQNYEQEINQLHQENKILAINFSKVDSLKHLEGYVQYQNLQKTGSEIEYIRVLKDTALAK